MANTLTKEIRYTALWGGNLARTTGSTGRWLGIPTGHQNTIFNGGTSSNPDADYSLATTADDLCSVIWQPLSSIVVKKCKIFYGQGGTTNTTHKLILMRYDIDADGDLDNGVDTGEVKSFLNSDDSSHMRGGNLTITTDNAVTSSQVLIAFVNCVDDVNTAMGAKCIIEYTM